MAAFAIEAGDHGLCATAGMGGEAGLCGLAELAGCVLGEIGSGHDEEADRDAAVRNLLGAAVELEEAGGAAEGRELAMRRVFGMGGPQQLAGDLEGEHGKAEGGDDRLEAVEGGLVLPLS
jgi:hypothetical protein